MLGLRRPLRIVTGYVAACLVAGALLAAVIVALLPDKSPSEIVPAFFAATVAMARIAGIVALLPSVLVLGILEWRAERRWFIYAAFGAVLAAAAGIVISGAMAVGGAGNPLVIILGSALLGAVSLTAYWRIAGRFAGRSAVSAPA